MTKTRSFAVLALVSATGGAFWVGCASDTTGAAPPSSTTNTADASTSTPPVDSGSATLTCTGGQTACGGTSCVDLQTNRESCGTCGKVCAPSEVCSQGACGLTCGGGTTKCGDKCVDTAIDEANCGTCGNVCGAGQTCQKGDAGAAACVCATGLTNCSGACVDKQSNDLNCGTCGNACTGGKQCGAGTCRDAISDWHFEDDLTDARGANNGVADGTMTYVTPSWSASRGKAARFNNTNSVVVATPTGVPLAATARTLQAWVRPTGASDGTYNGILSYGARGNPGEAQLLSWQNNGWLSSANWYNDLLQSGGRHAYTGSFAHMALTFDGTNRRLYLNGNEVAGDVPALFNTVTGELRIASTDTPGRRFIGDIDDVRIYDYARSPAQLAADSNVDVAYLFTGGADTDTGPNATTTATRAGGITAAADRKGVANNALAFDGVAGTFYTASPFWQLGAVDRPFTIGVWIKPAAATPQGAIVHLSSGSDGGGWCLPAIALDATGKPVANSWPPTSATAANPVVQNTWVHIAMSWSPQTLKLYVNGKLEQVVAQSGYAASGLPNYITLGSVQNGATCYPGIGVPEQHAQFNGAIDDFKVFGRELTAAEIAAEAK